MIEQNEKVSVCIEGKGEVKQPTTFRCCPLGLQFYAEEDVTEYQIMNFTMDAGDDDREPLNCSGIVVHSQFDDAKKMYRVWVMFTDIPSETQTRLKCISKEEGFICPHCENM